jgi:hypothetical protein
VFCYLTIAREGKLPDGTVSVLHVLDRFPVNGDNESERDRVIGILANAGVIRLGD